MSNKVLPVFNADSVYVSSSAGEQQIMSRVEVSFQEELIHFSFISEKNNDSPSMVQCPFRTRSADSL